VRPRQLGLQLLLDLFTRRNLRVDRANDLVPTPTHLDTEKRAQLRSLKE